MNPVFAVIMLICGTNISMPDCTVDTATDVVRGPDANSIFDCGYTGQAMIASTALGPGLGKDQYLKIVCADKHHLPALTASHPPIQRPTSAAADAKP
jgi:hypothetical protein